MSSRYFKILLFTAFTSLQWLSALSWIVSTAPHGGRTNVPFDTSLTVTFDRNMDESSFTHSTVKVYGSMSGRREGVIQYASAGRRLTVLPERPFTVGETVTMVLTKGIKSSALETMDRSYQFSFIIKPTKQTSGSFIQTGKIKTKYGGQVLQSADLNNDGTIDMALTANGQLTFMKNQGGGVYFIDSMMVDRTLGEFSIADINADGFMDLAALTLEDQGMNALYVFMNQKNGSFFQDTVIQFDSAVCHLAARDFDGNGSIDIVVAHRSAKTLMIFKNDGTGGFPFRSTLAIPRFIQGLTTDDFNSDGFLDIAVASREENAVTVLLNNGDASFSAKPKFLLSHLPMMISSGDINGDHVPDIVIPHSSNNPNLISILTNNGDGDLIQTGNITSSGYGIKTHLTDWNGDGFLDIAISIHESPSAVLLYVNDGAGNFLQSSDLKFTITYPSVSSADLSQTGANDLAVYNASNPGYVHLYKSRSQAQSLYIAKPSVNFLAVPTGATKTIWLNVMNLGISGSLNLSDLSFMDTSFAVAQYPSSIPAGTTDSIGIRYSPANNVILFDTLTIHCNDAAKPIVKVPVNASAGTSVSGIISGNVSWTRANSPYVITGLTVIDNGATVNIQAGVKVMVQSNALLNVDGTLNLMGTSNDTILITSVQPGMTRFPGINIRGTGKISLAYVQIEYAENGIKAFAGSTITNAHHVLFRYNGIGLDVGSTVSASFITAYQNGTAIALTSAKNTNTFSDVYIHDNDIGINASAENLIVSKGVLEKNRIGINGVTGAQSYSNLKFNNNGSGIYVHNVYPALNVRYCEFENNSQNGIWISNTTGGIISDNILKGNFKGIDGVVVQTIKDNIVTDCDSSGISVMDGALVEGNTIENCNYGIIVRGSSFPTVRYNTITKNMGVGIYQENAADNSVYTMNNFYDNGQYDLKINSQTQGTINATGNYWGTVSDSIIQLRIFDYFDDGVTTKVNYKPFALKRVSPYGDHEPSISITPVSGVKSGVVSIAYQLADIEQEILHCKYYYSLNGTVWTVIPGTDTAGIPFAKYRGTFLWKSREVLDGYTGYVYVKIIPSDKYLAGAYDSVKISLDNNYAPSASIQSSTGEKRVTGYFKNAVSVQYSISDPESDSVSFLCSFRIDTAGSEWKQASGVTVGGKNKPGNGSVVWTTANEPLTVPGKYYFRITPMDIKYGLSDSLLLSIDPIGVPAISMDRLMKKEYSGDIAFRYKVIHDQNDTITLQPEYSLSNNGVWKKATVQRPTLLPDSLHYSDSLIWNSAADLDGVDNSAIRFRITPVHILNGFAGIQDSLHIDNNALPSILSIVKPSAKVSGSYTIAALPSDKEKDSIRFFVEYTVSGSSVWKTATVSSIVFAVDTAFIRWQTDKDLFNKDVEVLLRITPMDNDTGASFTSSLMRVDNLSGPVLLSSGGMMFTNDTLTVVLDRTIQQSSVSGAISVSSKTNGSVPFTAAAGSTPNQFRIIISQKLSAAETLTVSISGNMTTGLKDSLGNSFDGNKNGDLDGSPGDDKVLVFTTGLLGDFNLDTKLTIDDLVLFRTIWNTQDLKREIGPASSQPPKMSVQPDGKIDFEDIMVFVQNWNWRMINSGPANLFRRDAKYHRTDPETDTVSLKSAQIAARSTPDQHSVSRKTERFAMTYTSDSTPIGFDLAFHYDPTAVTIVSVSDGRVFDNDGGAKTLMLTHNDTLRGIYNTALVNLGPLKNIRDQKVVFVDVIPAGSQPATIEIIGAILKEDGSSQPTFNKITVDEHKLLPTRYDLAQNYPNPFNPSTTIDYQLPKDSRITLKVFNMLGQEVATLVDGELSAGYYSAQWNASTVSSGVYIYRLQSKEFVRTNKMILMK